MDHRAIARGLWVWEPLYSCGVFCDGFRRLWEASRDPVGVSFEASWGQSGGLFEASFGLLGSLVGLCGGLLGASGGPLRAEGSNCRVVSPLLGPS